MSAVDAAHTYGRRGWRVIPLHHITGDGSCSCRSGPLCPPKTQGKHPIASEWQNLASSAGADIQAWWDDNPNAGIGVATGKQSNLWVLDIDGATGYDTITRLAEEHGAMPRTHMVKTGSGGLHYYWTHPDDFTVHNSTSWVGPGIDVRGQGGQVVAPPSVSGRGAYEILIDTEPAPAPAWLVELVREHATNYEAGRTATIKPAEPIDMSFLPEKVRTLASTLVEEDQGRFRHFYALIAACREARLTQGQAVTLAEPWCQAVGKFHGRVASEVARAWGKLDAADARAEAWMPGITEGSTALAATHALADLDRDDDGIEGGEGEVSDLVASWAPLDLSSILDGTYVPEEPTLMARTDGAKLLYPRRVHSFHGESESGKSMVLQAASANVLADPDGGLVLYVDFESDQGAVITRLIQMGAPREEIRERLHYLRPEGSPYGLLHEREAWGTLLSNTYSLAVLDGVTEALVTYGAGSMDNDEITAWMRRVPRLIAQRTNAAVALVDHVSKSTESRGRFAIGGQAKLAALDGAAYSVEVVDALGRGMAGAISLRVAKDRPGAVRPHSGPYRKSDRTQEAARVTVDSTGDDGSIVVTVGAPDRLTAADNGQTGEWRPTGYMDRISGFLDSTGGAVGMNEIIRNVGGKKAALQQAIKVLVDEGYVSREASGQSVLHTSLRRYYEGSEVAGEPEEPQPGPRVPTGSQPGPGTQGKPVDKPGPRVPLPLGGTRSRSQSGESGLSENETTGSPGPGPRVVERVIGGSRVQFDLDTGEIVG